jgi:hypothetical protein
MWLIQDLIAIDLTKGLRGKILRPVTLLPDKAERLYTPTGDIKDSA